MDQTFFDFVLDEGVDCVRFSSTELATLFYSDGSSLTIVRKDSGWRISAGAPPYDAATATGMYD